MKRLGDGTTPIVIQVESQSKHVVMKVLKSKKPYLILLAIFFGIAVTDSFLWSHKLDPLIVEVDTVEDTQSTTSKSYIQVALKDEGD